MKYTPPPTYKSMTALEFAMHLPTDVLAELAKGAVSNGMDDVARLAAAAMLADPPIPKDKGVTTMVALACALSVIETPPGGRRAEVIAELDEAGCFNSDDLVDWAGLVHEADARDRKAQKIVEDWADVDAVDEILKIIKKQGLTAGELQELIDRDATVYEEFQSYSDRGLAFPPEMATVATTVLNTLVCYV